MSSLSLSAATSAGVRSSSYANIHCSSRSYFFFHGTEPSHIYTLSLHDALPIYARPLGCRGRPQLREPELARPRRARAAQDRKSTRLNSSHEWTSYAVFCLKKKRARKKCTGAELGPSCNAPSNSVSSPGRSLSRI